MVGLVALSGCGSSKPAYCSTRNDLEKSVNALENSIKGLTLSHFRSGMSDVNANLKKVQSDANELVSQVKSEFASETSAVKSSVTSFVSAVKGLESSPQTGAGQSAALSVQSAALSVQSSLKAFADATSSKCS